MKKVFLDLDGVLVDLVSGVHDALNVEYSIHAYPYEPGNYDIFGEMEKRKYNRVYKGQVYKLCNKPEFWEGLEWMADGQHILKACVDAVGKQNVVICTKPMMGVGSWTGKIQWLKSHGIHRNIILIDATKSLLAHPDCILIDDRDENIDEFVDAGGKGFLIPRPWNRGFSEWKSGKPFMEDLNRALTSV